MDSDQSPKVLFLSLSGIGNYLMHAPTIAALKEERPGAEITVWVAPRGTKALALADPNVDKVVEAQIRRSVLLIGLHTWNLARRRFDVAIMLSPGQLWKGAAHMFLAGIHERIAHHYSHLGNPKSSFLLTRAIPEVEGMHDIEQNLRLLSELGIDDSPYHNSPYSIAPLGEADKAAAEKLITGMRIDASRRLVGLHAGSAPDFTWKRWPRERFIELGRTLTTKHNAHVAVFGGPDERDLKKELVAGIGKHASTVSGSLLATAGVMQQCAVVVANDSGLMHLAAATGTPTIGLFGPTDEQLTGPRGQQALTLRAPGTSAVYSTELQQNLGTTTHESLLGLATAEVEQAVLTYL